VGVGNILVMLVVVVVVVVVVVEEFFRASVELVGLGVGGTAAVRVEVEVLRHVLLMLVVVVALLMGPAVVEVVLLVLEVVVVGGHMEEVQHITTHILNVLVVVLAVTLLIKMEKQLPFQQGALEFMGQFHNANIRNKQPNTKYY
jgi:hypothetical protein